MKRLGLVRNRLLDALSPADRALLINHLNVVTLSKGEVLFEPGESIVYVHFPGFATVASLVLNLQHGGGAEVAMIGPEGAVGGIVSSGHKPAFTRGVVEVAGLALRLAADDLEKAKLRSPT